MESLLGQTLGGKKEHVAFKWFRFVTFGIAIASLVMSIIGLSLGNKSYLESSLFAYEFPNWADFMPVDAGKVVSISPSGNVMEGAGVSINRNETETFNKKALKNVKVWNVNDWLIVTASNGLLRFFEIDPSSIAMSGLEQQLPQINGADMVIDNFIRMSNTTFVLLGSNVLLPFTVDFKFNGPHDISITCTLGSTTALPTGASYPKIDYMDEKTVCVSYEGADNQLYTFIAETAKDAQGNLKMSMNTPVSFSYKYGYHGIAGLSSKNYIVAATGEEFNSSSSGRPERNLRVALVTLDNSKNLVVANWTVLPFSMSMNYFDMDNFDERNIFIAYTNSFNNNGIEMILLHYDQSSNSLYWGSSLTYKSSGAVINNSKLVLSLLAMDRLALTYSDASAHGSLAMGMVELTSAGDLVKTGPEFIITRPQRGTTVSDWYFDTCMTAPWRFVIVESQVNNQGSYSTMHIGSYGPRPVGVVTKSLFGKSLVQFAGTVGVSNQKLTPGYMYYTNENGELLRGRPAGFAHREFGAFYVSNGNYLLSLHNQVGIAVSESELLLKFY
ncbi:hypothetical protein WA158_004608 [Blastocystis sp. Blastoise]